MSAAARGIIVDAADARLVIEASPEQVARFAVGAPVGVAASPEAISGVAAMVDDLHAHPFLYDRHGRRVAAITGVTVTTPHIDMTTFGDASPRFVLGLQSFSLQAEGPL